MATFLLTWELGAGIGHITRLQPIAQCLSARGHAVYLAVRDVSACYEFLSELDVSILQAPVDPAPRVHAPVTETYAHVLFNCGFAEPKRLEARVASWRHLFDLIAPDLVVCDCSPTALLAAHCHSVSAVALGTGFECPPDVSPLPSLRRLTETQSPSENSVEEIVLRHINDLAQRSNASAFVRLAQLYHQQHEPMLLTFRELDCYPTRAAARYWGPVIFSSRREVHWPEGDGPRVFAYILDHPFSPELLQILAERAWPTIVVGGRDSIASFRSSRPTSVHIADNVLDSRSLAAQCDVTICYGGHGTICVTLLAGKPLLILPITVEQFLNGAQVSDLRAGEMGKVGDLSQVAAALEQIVATSRYKEAAQRFAAEYSAFTTGPNIPEIATHVEMLASKTQS